METKGENIKVRVINQNNYKETHGLFINGLLQHIGTENECVFLELKLQHETTEELNHLENDEY